MYWLAVLEPHVLVGGLGAAAAIVCRYCAAHLDLLVRLVLVDGLGAVAAVVCRYCAAHLDLLDVAIGSRACVRAGSRAVLADAPTMLRAEDVPSRSD